LKLNFSYNNQRNQQFDPYGNLIKDPTGLNGDFTTNGSNNSVNNPLAHLNDSVNSLDPLNAMEKSLNDQVNDLECDLTSVKLTALFDPLQMPHTPHTHSPLTPGGPPSVPPANDMQNGTSNSNNSNSPQHQQNILNSASNIMNSPQSLMNSPQNMMNSPQNMNQNMQQNLMNSIPNLTDVDLNFDPAAVIDGEGGTDLNVSLNDEIVT
jgi:zinc finger MIZ domain-containing protein